MGLKTFLTNLREPVMKWEETPVPDDEDLAAIKTEFDGWTPPTADQLGDGSLPQYYDKDYPDGV